MLHFELYPKWHSEKRTITGVSKMKKRYIFAGIFCLTGVLVLFCNKKEGNIITPDVGSRVLGTWEFSPPILPDSTRLALIMKSENKYTIEVTQMNNKKLFNSDGTWSSSADSIILSGEHCQYYDTVTSQLVDMDNQTCSTPLILPYPDSDTTWSIKTTNFSMALSSLPIPPEALAPIYANIHVIVLMRMKQ